MADSIVAAAREVGIEVQATIRNYSDPLPTDMVARFTTPKGTPKIWGEALDLRIQKQKASFRNNNPMGSYDLEKMKWKEMVVTMKNFYMDESIYKYPESYERLVELDLVNFDIWFLMESEQATNIYSGMKKRYPNRKLIPFAKRVDNDDTACFEIGKGSKVQLIHDFASEGFEQRKEFDDFWEWVEVAMKEMIDYNRSEEIE